MRKMILIKFNLRFLTVYIFSLVRERERIRRKKHFVGFSPKRKLPFFLHKNNKMYVSHISQYKFNASMYRRHIQFMDVCYTYRFSIESLVNYIKSNREIE